MSNMFENYSPGIIKALKKIDAKIGEKILIVANREKYEGVLMPRTEIGDKNCLVLKLDSGYNIGVKINTGTKIQKIKKALPKEIGEETEFELGKRRENIIKNLKFDPNKPSLSVIATGGTIASRVDYKTGGVAPLEKPEEFLLNVPELEDIVNITKILNPFNIASEDMTHKNWQKIAELAAKELNLENNLIITHGTDTLHFTAAALSFMLQNLSKPVVLVGAQRSSDRGSSDTATNLICSAYAALSSIGEVGICMHGSMDDEFCTFNRGTRVRKMHTSRRDTFHTLGDFPLAKIWTNGKLEILSTEYKRREEGEVTADTKIEPKVALLKAYPNSEPEILNFLAKKKYKGIVIEGTGLGHVPVNTDKEWITVIKKLVKDGIPVVVVPQTLYGRINTNVYSNLRKLYHDAGAIQGEDMLPETAYVKLSWVLGHTNEMEEVKKMMLKNFAGEINERSRIKVE